MIGKPRSRDLRRITQSSSVIWSRRLCIISTSRRDGFMRVELVVVALCMLYSGCQLSDNAWRTAVSEPLHYHSSWHDKWARVRFRRLAHQALEQERALARADRDDYCNEPFTPAHELGFVDGFVDNWSTTT